MAFCQRYGLRIPILQAPPVGSCQLVKRLERGEPCQGGQVALELLAPREVERLE
jgi:hypothetical protein